MGTKERAMKSRNPFSLNEMSGNSLLEEALAACVFVFVFVFDGVHVPVGGAPARKAFFRKHSYWAGRCVKRRCCQAILWRLCFFWLSFFF